MSASDQRKYDPVPGLQDNVEIAAVALAGRSGLARWAVYGRWANILHFLMALLALAFSVIWDQASGVCTRVWGGARGVCVCCRRWWWWWCGAGAMGNMFRWCSKPSRVVAVELQDLSPSPLAAILLPVARPPNHGNGCRDGPASQTLPCNRPTGWLLAPPTCSPQVPYSGFGIMSRVVLTICCSRILRVACFMSTVLPSPRPGCYARRFPPVPPTLWGTVKAGYTTIRGFGGCNDLIFRSGRDPKVQAWI